MDLSTISPRDAAGPERAPTRSRTAGGRAAIGVSGLRKSFGTNVVLDGIDITVLPASVFALLGPNGAGKSTTVHILSTLIPCDGGSVQVEGHDLGRDPEGVRAAIGVTGQFSAVDGLLTGEENLLLMADLRHLGRNRGRAKAAELLERFDLAEAAKRPVQAYSGGMKRRLDLAMTLVGEPRIIFLDEPTAGLDPRSRRTVWAIVGELVASGTTIFLTTQYLEEADRLADRIAVLHGGRLVAEGTPAELKRLVPGGHVLLRFDDDDALTRAAALFPYGIPEAEDLSLLVPGETGIAALRDLIEALDGAGLAVAELSVHSPDLDDVFLALTEKEAVA